MILDTTKLMDDAAYREDMRHRFITDHFFAAEMLGFRDFHPVLHKPAVDLYFPKNPNLPITQQHPKHNRMHLDPRGTFKTTLHRIDKVQWYAAFPDKITILTESATTPLAEAISASIVKPFWRARGKGATPLQLMFPELCFDKLPEGKWNNPDHEQDSDLDTTLAFTSPQSTQSGWHPYVMSVDDMVDTKNSGIDANPEVRQSVINTYDQNENLLRGGGYIYLVGTRYHPFDLYGTLLNTMDRDQWEVLIRSTMTVKNGAKLVPGEFPAEDDVEMHFAALLGMDYGSMRAKYMKNYESFMCQQQNDPQGGSIPTFDEKMYLSCQIEAARVPFGGHDAKVYVCWRPRYGAKPGMEKYLEGAAAKVVDGKVYVLGAWQTTRTPSGEAELIVQVAKELQPDVVMLLDVPGSDHLWPQVRNEAARRNVSLKLQRPYWTEDDATRGSEIKGLEPLMKVGRLMFSTGMSKAAECQKQFVHFGLVEETGIVECIAKFADMVPMSQMRANMEEEELEYRRRQKDNQMLQHVLGMESGRTVVDEQLRQKAMAHIAAMQTAVTYDAGGPPLPGGLDG